MSGTAEYSTATSTVYSHSGTILSCTVLIITNRHVITSAVPIYQPTRLQCIANATMQS